MLFNRLKKFKATKNVATKFNALPRSSRTDFGTFSRHGWQNVCKHDRTFGIVNVS